MTPRWPGWTKRAGGARPQGRNDPLHRPHDHPRRRRSTKGREFFTRKVKGDAQAKLYTRIDGKVLLFDPMKIDPSGKVGTLWPGLFA